MHRHPALLTVVTKAMNIATEVENTKPHSANDTQQTTFAECVLSVGIPICPFRWSLFYYPLK